MPAKGLEKPIEIFCAMKLTGILNDVGEFEALDPLVTFQVRRGDIQFPAYFEPVSRFLCVGRSQDLHHFPCFGVIQVIQVCDNCVVGQGIAQDGLRSAPE